MVRPALDLLHAAAQLQAVLLAAQWANDLCGRPFPPVDPAAWLPSGRRLHAAWRRRRVGIVKHTQCRTSMHTQNRMSQYRVYL